MQAEVTGFSDVAVLIPCYNEECTVASVVEDFSDALPGAEVYVYDNCCTDSTADVAEAAGAKVRYCHVPGKGATVQQMFRNVKKDRILMVDGDGTYPAEYARMLLSRLAHADMVVGDRLSYNYYEDNKRLGHGIGNWLVRFLVNWLYHGNVLDVMSGYRAFRKSFVKSVVLEKTGFEVETEMTIWALQNNCKIGSVPVMYRERPKGSKSKLHTIRDGMKVLCLIFQKKWGSH